ncbi:17823_t:CDS:2 [Rhizophagus irregularis]|nr:17823_t:CDS:2 [Rhizophagus irregularis]
MLQARNISPFEVKWLKLPKPAQTSILPPHPAEYRSPDELFKNVQTFAKSQGYALVILTIAPWVLLKKHAKDIKSRLIDCPFELYAARQMIYGT